MAPDFSRHSAARWGCLPTHMHLLMVMGEGRESEWLTRVFTEDSVSQVTTENVEGQSAALIRLRDKSFDALLVHHDPGSLDAIVFLEALRAAEGEMLPATVVGNLPSSEMNVMCYEAGADSYVYLAQATVRELLWHIARGVERRELLAENLRLLNQQRQRLQIEHNEASHLLTQQRGLIWKLGQICDVDASQHSHDKDHGKATVDLTTFSNRYRDLLRTYIVMGSGSLNAELRSLADSLAAAGISAQQTLQIHLQILEETVQSLGNRSARHVMNRADLLILELMMHLCDGYSHQQVQLQAASTQQAA